MQTKEVDDDPGTRPDERLASNNFSVARVKRDVLANSDVGAIFTSRQAAAGSDYNRTIGADGNFRFGSNLSINGYLARTLSDEAYCAENCRELAEKIGTEWRDNRLRLQAIYANIEEHFNPEVGLKGVPSGRDSARSLRTTAELHLRPFSGGWIREVAPHYRFFFILDADDQTIYKEGHYSPFEIFFHNGARVEMSFNPRFDRLDEPFDVPNSPGVAVPPGDYHYGYWGIELESDPSQPLFATANIQAGSYYTGDSETANISATLRPGYRWSVQATLQNSHVRLQGSDYTNRVFRTRLVYSISTQMFLNALIQYNSSRKQVTSNIRFDFIHRPLSDIFIVYNEARDVSGAGRDDRVFTVKYTHMLAF
jgi:hypothetical protein